MIVEKKQRLFTLEKLANVIKFLRYTVKGNIGVITMVIDKYKGCL